MKKIIYIANIRLPTEKAHGIQIMKTCESFAEKGIDVNLVVPRRLNKIKQDPFEYYSVKKNFKITRLPVLDLVKFGKIGFWIETITFAESIFWFSLLIKGPIFFTRDEVVAFYLANLKKNVIWEAHMGSKNWFIKRIIKNKISIITITNGLKNLYMLSGADERRLLVAPDAVDLEKFKISISKNEARKMINLPLDKKIFLYAGHLYSWKGADTVAQCSKYLNNEKVLITFVGGTDSDIERFKKSYGSIKNILIIGRKQYKEIPVYMKSADVLLLPNSSKENISRIYTSPMKLFEYMASEAPIIASDLPSIKEILNEDMAYFFEADNPESLASVIENLLRNENEAKMKAKKAYEEVDKYSWQKRADKIISFANSLYKI